MKLTNNKSRAGNHLIFSDLTLGIAKLTCCCISLNDILDIWDVKITLGKSCVGNHLMVLNLTLEFTFKINLLLVQDCLEYKPESFDVVQI